MCCYFLYKVDPNLWLGSTTQLYDFPMLIITVSIACGIDYPSSSDLKARAFWSIQTREYETLKPGMIYLFFASYLLAA